MSATRVHVVLALLLSSIYAPAQPADDADMVIHASLVHLLANPEPFLGKAISVTGYLDEYESYLYLTREHSVASDSVSAVGVRIHYREEDVSEQGIASTGCGDKFVRVIGIFSESQGGFHRVDQIRSIYSFDGDGIYGDTTASRLCWSNSTE